MKRTGFNLLVILSLLLAVATSVVWPTQRHRLAGERIPGLDYATPTHYYLVGFQRAGIYLATGTLPCRPDEAGLHIWRGGGDKELWAGIADHPFLFTYGTQKTMASGHPNAAGRWFYYAYLHYAILTYGSLLIGFLLLPAFAVYRRFTHLCRKGQCQKCGYDLRATPDRCPECGTIPRGGPVLKIIPASD